MRSLVVCLGLAACRTDHPAAQQEPAGSAKPVADPWNAAPGPHSDALQAGSAEPIPNWAHDPPAVLRDKILAVNAHADVLKRTVAFAEYRDVLALAEHMPGVVAAEPFTFSELVIATPGKAGLDIAIKGVDPTRVGRVLGIAKSMKVGTLASLGEKNEPPPMLIGDDLARKLAVSVGDTVELTSHDSDKALQIKPTRFRIAGLFHVDFDEYDERLALVPLSAAQKMIGRGDQVMGIEMTVKDLEHSGELAKTLEKKLGGAPYQVMDWYELNTNLFHAMYGDRRP